MGGIVDEILVQVGQDVDAKLDRCAVGQLNRAGFAGGSNS